MLCQLMLCGSAIQNSRACHNLNFLIGRQLTSDFLYANDVKRLSLSLSAGVEAHANLVTSHVLASMLT